MGEVWRAQDRLRGSEVALKRIRPLRLTQRAVAASETLLLTQEFRLLSGLHHPNVISVQDYGLDKQGWPYYTMRLLESAVTISTAATTCHRVGRLRLLIQLFHGLAYLHRRNVLHRDLKPSNVLVVGDRVYIVDFGLSIATEQADRVEALAGTIHYLAPELLENSQPSERTDVYSAGLIAFEVLTGKHPFRTSSRAKADGGQRPAQPDFQDPHLGDGIGSLLRQMLARNPLERPHDLTAIIALFSRLAGDLPSAPTEPGARDGFARAAPLVGRDRELGELVLDLVAAGDGNGRSRLVVGMVGAGKTRLIEELRSLALVRGVVVVDGHNPAEGGQPFAPWREALRQLIIEQDVPEEFAVVLKPLIPDLDALLERPLGSAPELDAGGNLARLAAVVAGLIRSMQRPVLLMLEDLHWAGPESIELFAALVKAAEDLPLFLLATARGDEAPDLAERLAVSNVTALPPLDQQALTELASATIGPAGRSSTLVQLLIRESEGNPFFAVEVLRAAVERAGGWERVGTTALPHQLLVGGMQAIAARRLDRLTTPQRLLVETAAIAGRELNFDVLEKIQPREEWLQFLHHTGLHGLIEPRGGRWSFIHDQLRMAVIDGMQATHRRMLHHKIAEAVALDPSRPGIAAELAYHWRQAEMPSEEAQWTVHAIRDSLAVGAYQVALAHSCRVLALASLIPPTALRAIDLQEIRFAAGNAAFRAGDFPEARIHLLSVLAHAGKSMPTTVVRRAIHLIGQVLVQIAHRIPGGSRAWFPRAQSRREYRLLAETWEMLARVHIYAGDGLGVLLCAMRASNLSENLGSVLPYAHGLIGVTATAARGWKIAAGYFSRAQKFALTTGDQLGLVDTLVMEGSAYLGAARFDDALNTLHRARAQAEALNYRLGQGQALILEGVCHGYAADLGRMLTASCESIEAIRLHSHGHQAGFRCGQAKALILLGRLAEARAILEQSRQVALEDDRLARSLIAASLITVHVREGNHEAASRELEELARASAEITAIPPPCSILLEAPAELVIARWHLALRHGDPVADLAREANQRWRALANWAKIFPLGQPAAEWVRGHQLFLQARQAEAWAAWERGRTLAVKLGMPFYEAQISLSLANHGPRPQQRQHRFRAHALFSHSQAMWHVRQLDELNREDESGSNVIPQWPSEDASATRTAAYNQRLVPAASAR